MVTIGMQLTDVVETANASSNENKTFFPLVIASGYVRPRTPVAVSAETAETASFTRFAGR